MNEWFLQPPGSAFGPCTDECTHADCRESRMMAEALCSICGERIGYQRLFTVTIDNVFTHHACTMTEVFTEVCGLDSSNIHAFSYDHRKATLDVQFRTTAVYRYSDVSAQEMQDFLEAESFGQHFNKYLKLHRWVRL